LILSSGTSGKKHGIRLSKPDPVVSVPDAMRTNPGMLACQSIISDFALWASPHQTMQSIVGLTASARLNSLDRLSAEPRTSKRRPYHEKKDKRTEIEWIFRGVSLQIGEVPRGSSEWRRELLDPESALRRGKCLLGVKPYWFPTWLTYSLAK
jgi:hypothetical protein